MKSITHKISVPTFIKIGEGVIDFLYDFLNEEKVNKVLYVTDSNLYNLYGNDIIKSFNESSIDYQLLIIENDTLLEELVAIAYEIINDIQFIVGVGGGSIIDRVKYISYLRKTPWISVPTAPSNDGFASPISSLYVKKTRVSMPAKTPYGIIVDTEILSICPYHMLMSGIGDSVSNLTAVYDMELETNHFNTHIDDFSAMISLQSIESFLQINYEDVRSLSFLKSLMTSLTLNGIAMEVAGTSKPSSGSEHLISHSIDKLLMSNNYSHGVQVGLATYIISLVQNNRSEEISGFFEDTGFWDYVKSLKISKSMIAKAIKLAPSIKDHRFTVLHIEGNVDKAVKFLDTDVNLQNILF